MNKIFAKMKAAINPLLVAMGWYVKNCVKVRLGLLGLRGEFSELQTADHGIEH